MRLGFGVGLTCSKVRVGETGSYIQYLEYRVTWRGGDFPVAALLRQCCDVSLMGVPGGTDAPSALSFGGA